MSMSNNWLMKKRIISIVSAGAQPILSAFLLSCSPQGVFKDVKTELKKTDKPVRYKLGDLLRNN